jgi:PEGA domain
MFAITKASSLSAVLGSVAIGRFFGILRETPRADDRGFICAGPLPCCCVVHPSRHALQFRDPAALSSAPVSLESNPPGAEARLSSSGASCRTPCTLPVKVSDYNVTFALAGYTPRFVPIRVLIKREHWYSPEVTYVDPNPVMALLQPTPPPPASEKR